MTELIAETIRSVRCIFDILQRRTITGIGVQVLA